MLRQTAVMSLFTVLIVAAWVLRIAEGKSLDVPLLMTLVWALCFWPWWSRVRRDPPADIG